MTIEELHTAIETYPHRLYQALEAVEKAEKAIERLNEQIEEEEANLSPIVETVEKEQIDENIQETLIKLEHELALLEVKCEQTKGELELEYRRNPPQGDKVTEATVTAYVKSHPKFVEAKERCLKKKFERDTANVSRRLGYTASMIDRRTEKVYTPVTSQKLIKLQGRLLEAEGTLAYAEMKLEEIKASILPNQLLVQLYTAGLIK